MRVDVRIISATNVNMKEAMAQKSFREDLYYRLNGISLVLPRFVSERRRFRPLSRTSCGRERRSTACNPCPYHRS
jgi:transcriptional regulator of acetoin/glycerol metabolism